MTEPLDADALRRSIANEVQAAHLQGVTLEAVELSENLAPVVDEWELEHGQHFVPGVEIRYRPFRGEERVVTFVVDHRPPGLSQEQRSAIAREHYVIKRLEAARDRALREGDLDGADVRERALNRRRAQLAILEAGASLVDTSTPS